MLDASLGRRSRQGARCARGGELAREIAGGYFGPLRSARVRDFVWRFRASPAIAATEPSENAIDSFTGPLFVAIFLLSAFSQRRERRGLRASSLAIRTSGRGALFFAFAPG